LSFKINSPAFNEGKAVILTSLINKIGSIGLMLIPILLIEKKIPSRESSMVMSVVRFISVLGPLISGYISDKIGLKKSLLLAYFCSAFGLIFIPHQTHFILLSLFGIFIQLGNAYGNIVIRLLLSHTVSSQNQKEALGWVRLVVNLGQLISYALSSIVYKFGTMIFFLFDGLTSILALVYAFFKINFDGSNKKDSTKKQAQSSNQSLKQILLELKNSKNTFYFYSYALVLSLFTFLYDLFFAGVIAKLKIIYPNEGLKFFSYAMLLNTFFCMIFAIRATKIFSNIFSSMVLCMSLMIASVLIGINWVSSVWVVVVVSLLGTFAEIIYGALSHYVLLKLNPSSSSEGLVYSTAIFINGLGKVLAAMTIFPLIIYSKTNTLIIIIASLAFLISIFLLFKSKNFLEKIS